MKKDPSSAQTCIAIENMPSIHQADISLLDVPLIIANKETFADYGRLVYQYKEEQVWIETWPTPNWRPIEAGTGNEGGVAEGKFQFKRAGNVMTSQNHAVNGHYITGWFDDPATASFDDKPLVTDHIFVREANYHPDSGQVFYPIYSDPFVALLALPGDDVKPENFVAFFCDGSFGIQIFPNIWHQPIFPIKQPASFMGKQGKVHACVACDFVTEFNCYLKVPLTLPKDKM